MLGFQLCITTPKYQIFYNGHYLQIIKINPKHIVDAGIRKLGCQGARTSVEVALRRVVPAPRNPAWPREACEPG